MAEHKWVTGRHNPYKWSYGPLLITGFWAPTWYQSHPPNTTSFNLTCSPLDPLDCDFPWFQKHPHGRKTGSTTQQSSPCTQQKSKSVKAVLIGVWKPHPSATKKTGAHLGISTRFFSWKTFKKNTFFKTLDLLRVRGRECRHIPQMVV